MLIYVNLSSKISGARERPYRLRVVGMSLAVIRRLAGIGTTAPNSRSVSGYNLPHRSKPRIWPFSQDGGEGGNASAAPTHSRSMASPFEKRAQSEVGQGQKQEKNKESSDQGAEGVRQRHRPIRLLTG